MDNMTRKPKKRSSQAGKKPSTGNNGRYTGREPRENVKSAPPQKKPEGGRNRHSRSRPTDPSPTTWRRETSTQPTPQAMAAVEENAAVVATPQQTPREDALTATRATQLVLVKTTLLGTHH